MLTTWDDVFRKKIKQKIITDNFIKKYEKYVIDVNSKILDLGSGMGNTSKVLLSYDKEVIAADSSKVALEYIKKNLNVSTIYLDMLEKFPFEDKTFDLIIADLSLHYFSEKDTFKILNEIKRILKVNGKLLFRVNSIRDNNYGASAKEEIEYHYYYAMGMKKRFFDLEDIKYFFNMFDIISVKEEKMLRYEKEKNVIEGIVKRAC